MRRRSERGMSIVEVMVGVVVLAVCTPPILACVLWMRSCAAESTIDAQVASALSEQVEIVRSLGQSAALPTGSTGSSQSLGNGITLTVNRTVAAVAGQPRLYKLVVV